MVFPYFEFIVGFIVITYLFETYLEIRQKRKFNSARSEGPPKELKGVIETEKFTKMIEYGSEKLRFGIFSDFIKTIHSLAILFFGGMPWLWARSGEVLERFDFAAEDHEILRSVVFLVISQLYNTFTELPFSLYSTFVIEEKYGFNKQTLKLFFIDAVKQFFLFLVLGVPILSLALKLIIWGGENFWLYVWVFMLVVSLFIMTIYPVFIAPLFNKFTPLEEGPLRTAIEDLAKKVGFPLTKIFVIDGSTRSAHSNAYFYGFFKNKRIVIYDTLIKQVDQDGIVAILGHELGHYKLSHNLKNLVIAQTHLLLFLYLFSRTLHTRELYEAFGFYTTPVFIGLALFSFLYGPIEQVFGFAMNCLSRHFEYQADEFAKRLGLELVQPLIKIHVENLGNLVPDEWYSTFHFSHPTLVERIRALEKYGKAAFMHWY
eukprot:TRINITY_DN6985_c0_g1_i1.p1 TRINITY_DN6985_c0_g1~~TRINITY_DN6985_c0_g1_i1.p1  ORF type:complete len:459 (+),score=115.40 TRINITY_DN6985_c0_g1_i1:90-1379(+)